MESQSQDTLGRALTDIFFRRPLQTLIAQWNWKMGLISAVVRATVFFLSNLRSGHHSALRASLTEAVFAVLIAGVLASITQRLRHTTPVWATALTVWLGVPALLVAVQSQVHRLSGTPHVKTGLIVSFVMAAFGSGFNWFAQRRGALLTEAGARRSFGQDLRAIPVLIGSFVTAPFRAALSAKR